VDVIFIEIMHFLGMEELLKWSVFWILLIQLRLLLLFVELQKLLLSFCELLWLLFMSCQRKVVLWIDWWVFIGNVLSFRQLAQVILVVREVDILLVRMIEILLLLLLLLLLLMNFEFRLDLLRWTVIIFFIIIHFLWMTAMFATWVEIPLWRSIL